VWFISMISLVVRPMAEETSSLETTTGDATAKRVKKQRSGRKKQRICALDDELFWLKAKYEFVEKQRASLETKYLESEAELTVVKQKYYRLIRGPRKEDSYEGPSKGIRSLWTSVIRARRTNCYRPTVIE
jgi:hypothetical protein